MAMAQGSQEPKADGLVPGKWCPQHVNGFAACPCRALRGFDARYPPGGSVANPTPLLRLDYPKGGPKDEQSLLARAKDRELWSPVLCLKGNVSLHCWTSLRVGILFLPIENKSLRYT